MPFNIIQQDITKLKVDAVVNAANSELRMGNGVCGAIFKAAGEEKLQAACDKFSPIKTGEAIITSGFNLPAKYVIHAVGPIYPQWSEQENEQLLCAAYTNSLKLAVENNCKSIAFPLISSGIYLYPKDKALSVAISAIQSFVELYDIDVTLVVYDKSTFVVNSELISDVERYIHKNYDSREINRICDYEVRYNASMIEESKNLRKKGKKTVSISVPELEFEDIIDNLDEPFGVTLLRLIDERGKSDVEVYKRANIDRKLFSKIRSKKGYVPSKKTAIALAIGLELSLEETKSLLEKAGYAISHSQKFDLIIEYFIKNGRYNIFEINEVLFKYDQALLG